MPICRPTINSGVAHVCSCLIGNQAEVSAAGYLTRKEGRKEGNLQTGGR